MRKKVTSILQTYDLDTGAATILKEFDLHLEAPNWTPDGKELVYNAGGLLYRFDLATRQSLPIDTGLCTLCNNDHVLSADGSFIALSAGTREDPYSRIWVVPFAGGQPRLVTSEAPSFLHGVSPDGKTLAYCAGRNGEPFNIYAIPTAGGQEIRLTKTGGLDDGPEYSPDGKSIWFNSVRSGLMQVWRMNADGSEQTQMTADEELNTWFPHLSPDGQHVVMISYHKGDVAPGDHPPEKNVLLRCMPSAGGHPTTLLSLFGGQGTMNVNSWSPDSKKFAFVSYRVES